MKYSKKHIQAVEKRLNEYEKVLASDKFVRLSICRVCRSVRVSCRGCLLNDCFSGNADPGHFCFSKTEQRKQYNHLLKKLDEKGYQFK